MALAMLLSWPDHASVAVISRRLDVGRLFPDAVDVIVVVGPEDEDARVQRSVQRQNDSPQSEFQRRHALSHNSSRFAINPGSNSI